jgi:hypothetical protein
MNNNVQNALADTIVKATSCVEQAGEFLLAETPSVLQELIAWKTGVAIFWAVFGLVIVVSGYTMARKAYLTCFKSGHGHRMCEDEEPLWIFGGFASMIAAIIGAIILVESLITLLQITLAPKIYLLEAAGKLLKGHSL